MGDRLRRFAFREELQDLRRRLSSVVNSQATTNQAMMAEALITPKIRVGFGATALIVLGGTQDIPITWSTPFATADYQVDVTPASGLLSRATTAVVSQTAAGCVVRVTAALAIVAGSNFVVVACCHAQ